MVRAPNFSPGQPGYKVPGYQAQQNGNTDHEHSRSHLIGLLRVKNFVFILIIASALLWFFDVMLHLGESVTIWWVLIASLVVQALGIFLFGAIIRRPTVLAFGLLSLLVSYFFLPYVYLSSWLGYVGEFFILGLGLLVVAKTDTLPRNTDHVFLRFCFNLAMYVILFLIFWNITALMSSSIYRIHEKDTEALSKEISQQLAGGERVVDVSSGVNLSGRFFFADFGASQGIEVYDKSGSSYKLPDARTACVRPYAYLPSLQENTNWLCRVLSTHWIFFYDYHTSFGQ
ncbi:MAG: hypothetical protein H6760_01725 [Candidatus Nomurabacteria bacterium]|nr:MAG: hypothetical protein H6760_01725 [Candidatus Nomurabacteria bacterium]